MRYADAYAQDQLDALMRRTGRPPNSSGWGMVECVKTGELEYRSKQPGVLP